MDALQEALQKLKDSALLLANMGYDAEYLSVMEKIAEIEAATANRFLKKVLKKSLTA